MSALLSGAGGTSCQLCTATQKDIKDTSTHFNNSALPLHSYTCVFRWFKLLIYRLNSGNYQWSPTSVRIKESMVFVRGLIHDQAGIKVDQPDPKGGTVVFA